VSEPDRDELDLLLPTAYLTVVLPLPLVDPRVIHDAAAAAVQRQPDAAVSAT
jgi:hypothetical protein